MAGSETSTTHDLLDKTRINYAQILLLAINDARGAFARGFNPGPGIDALLDILPPEVKAELTKPLVDLAVEYDKRLGWIDGGHIVGYHHVGGGVEDLNSPEMRDNVSNPRARPAMKYEAYLKYCRARFSLIINTLDEAGLLREYRREEVGGE